MTLQIALFCASDDRIDARWKQDAERLGRWLGEANVSLCYGGAPCGLMEITARAMHAAGNRRITAVATRSMAETGRISRYASERIVCETLAGRKETLMRRGDLAVALPGGIGTADEICTWLAAAQMGEHTKELVLCNRDGFYDALLAQFATTDRLQFSRPEKRRLTVTNGVDPLTALLAERIAAQTKNEQ